MVYDLFPPRYPPLSPTYHSDYAANDAKQGYA